MRGPHASFLIRRVIASRLLLGSVVLTVLVTTLLITALAMFEAQALPQAVRHQLERSPGVSVAISGAVNAATERADDRAVRHSMRAAFGTIPFQLDAGTWSDPLGLPRVRGSRTIPIAEAAALDRIRAQAVLVSGTWPGAARPGTPIEAVVPVAVASRLGLAPGGLLALRDRQTGHSVRIRVTGLFRPRQPASRYWGIDLAGRSGISVQPGFVTYGPMAVNPAAFTRDGLTVGEASWIVIPAPARIGVSQLGGLASRIARASTYLMNAARLGGLQVTTGLPRLLGGLGSSVVVARSLLTIGVLQLVLLAVAGLTLAARLLADHRESESALLSARGGARWQLAGSTVAEAATLAAVAAVAGALLGIHLAGLLARWGLLRDAGLRISGLRPDAWWAAAAVVALSVAVLVWPALRPPAPGAASVRRGRQAALAGIAWAGGDLALVALAVISVWELRSYSAVAHTAAGGLDVDPVLAVGPALALAGLAVIPLRLLPLTARAIDRVTASGRRLGVALASWEISRRPIRQSGPVLLAVLAVASGTLTLAQYESWRRSAADRAAFAAGADVRVDLLRPLPLGKTGIITRARHVTAAMPVARYPSAGIGELLALDSREASATALLRGDESPLPATALWRLITPSRAGVGLVLPGRPARLAITASLAPSTSAASLGKAAASLSVQDRYGTVYSVPAGAVPADGRSHRLIARLSGTGQASYPLHLLKVTLTYRLPQVPPRLARRAARHAAQLTVGSLAVASSRTGPFDRPFAPGAALAPWRSTLASPDLSTSQLRLRNSGAGGGRPSLVVRFHPDTAPTAAQLSQSPLLAAAAASFSDVLTVAAPPPVRTVPGIATSAFLRASQAHVGAAVPVDVGSVTIPVRIVASVARFPTVTGPGGALIVDQSLAADILASRQAGPLPVTQWWLRTATSRVPPGLPAGSAVTDRAAMVAALLSSPLSAIPEQAALTIAVAAALLAALGFGVSVAVSLRARRTQAALLAALGVAKLAQARLLCLEELLLSLPAALAGLLAGALVAHLVIPAVILTSAGAAPLPPVLTQIPVAWAALLAAAVAVIPVLAAALTIARRPDPAAELRAAEAVP